LQKKIDPGRVIRVGHSHSSGGNDFLAKVLRVYDDPESAVLQEGDFESLDLTIRQKLVEFYYAHCLYYYKPDVADYDIIMAIIQFLVEEISQRITHLFGEIWVVLSGHVPSGVFQTSNMDSWIVALLFYWYVTHQMSKMPNKMKKRAERYLVRCLIHIITQGDDHVIRLPPDQEIISFISIYGWSVWLQKYWGMRIRDMKTVKYLSIADNHGGLSYTGLCFLKYYNVLNPDFGRFSQPKYLSYRPTNDLVLRLLWSRSGESRDLYDLLLSVIGHAYGTYYSNRHAYAYLHTVYAHILYVLDVKAEVAIARMMQLKGDHVIKDIKKRGLSEESIMFGFPSVSKLMALNVVDPSREFLGGAY